MSRLFMAIICTLLIGLIAVLAARREGGPTLKVPTAVLDVDKDEVSERKPATTQAFRHRGEGQRWVSDAHGLHHDLGGVC